MLDFPQKTRFYLFYPFFSEHLEHGFTKIHYPPHPIYRLPYDDIFGGVSAMSVDHFRLVNGFSNVFWGWGGEDDDMSNRLRQKKLYISRYNSTYTGVFTSYLSALKNALF